MCEEDPNPWESIASDKWEEYSQAPGGTRDSVTGETQNTGKVEEGCEEEMGS